MREICNFYHGRCNTFLCEEPNFVSYNFFHKKQTNETNETKNIFTNRNHDAADYIYDWL